MIADLVPRAVVTVETRQEFVESTLFAEEEASLGRAAKRRRREFVTGRACARRALEQLGVEPCPIVSGDRGAPVWPAGVVGSITHCRGYRACSVAALRDIVSVGIDAEVDGPLPEGVLSAVASSRERQRLDASASEGIHLEKVLFSAKEAIYKSWFPATGTSLEFEDVDVSLDAKTRTFCGRLLVSAPVVGGRRLTEFRGRWSVEDGVVLTATAVQR
jgi:4'-phosphopantetheinyl transferase EntD